MKTYKEFYKYANKLALKWRYCKKQIIEKLILKNADDKTVNRIIKQLSDEKILDDSRAFEIDIFILEEKRYGFYRIKQYLLNKGYQKSLVDSYIFNKDIEIDNCCFHFTKASRKYKNYRYIESEKEKLINYLKRYGFNDKIIYEVIKAGINYENVK